MSLKLTFYFVTLAPVVFAFAPDPGWQSTRSSFHRDIETERLFNSTQYRCLDPEKVPIKTEYFGCKPKVELDSRANCKTNWYRNCESFCQMYTWWNYGQEVPFHDTFCEKGPCELREGIRGDDIVLRNLPKVISPENLSKSSQFNFLNPNLTAVSKARSKPKAQNGLCGYWTFVPYQVHSCGISANGKGQRFWIASWCRNVQQRGECSTTILQTPDKKPDGQFIFVATECKNPRKRLPFCWQNPIYLESGVSLDPQIRNDYNHAMRDGDPKENWAACMRGSWPKPVTNKSGHYDGSETIEANRTSFLGNFGAD